MQINQKHLSSFCSDVVAQIISKKSYRDNKKVKDVDVFDLINAIKNNPDRVFFVVEAVSNGATFIQCQGSSNLFVFDYKNSGEKPFQWLVSLGLTACDNVYHVPSDSVQDTIAAKNLSSDKKTRKLLSFASMRASGRGQMAGAKMFQAQNMQDRIVRYIDKMRNPSWHVEKEMLFNSFLACYEVFYQYYNMNVSDVRVRRNANTGNYEQLVNGNIRQQHACDMLAALAGFRGLFCWYDMIEDRGGEFECDNTNMFANAVVHMESLLSSDVKDMSDLIDYDRHKTGTYACDKALVSGVENVILLMVEICGRLLEKGESFKTFCHVPESSTDIMMFVDEMSLDQLFVCGYLLENEITEDSDADHLYEIAQSRAIKDWKDDTRERQVLVESFVSAMI